LEEGISFGNKILSAADARPRNVKFQRENRAARRGAAQRARARASERAGLKSTAHIM